MSATRCHVCSRACERELEPAVGALSAVNEPDVWSVVARNTLILEVCHRCWAVWPDDWKLFPPVGFGRWPDDRPHAETISLADLVDALQETAA